MDLKSYLAPLDGVARDKFAGRCKTSKGHLQNVMYGIKTCSTNLAVHIERETKGAVTRQELRADWRMHWPELAQQAKASKARKESAVA